MEIVQEASRVMVGLDVSKAWLDVHVTGRKRHFRVSNDKAGGAELVERLGGGSGIRVVMEASGGYERLPHHALVAQGVVTAIVNPKRVRDFAKAPPAPPGAVSFRDRIDRLLTVNGLRGQNRSCGCKSHRQVWRNHRSTRDPDTPTGARRARRAARLPPTTGR